MSPDAQRVVSVATEGDVLVHDAQTGALLLAIPWPGSLPIAVGFHNGPNSVVLVAMDGKVRLLSTTRQKQGDAAQGDSK